MRARLSPFLVSAREFSRAWRRLRDTDDLAHDAKPIRPECQGEELHAPRVEGIDDALLGRILRPECLVLDVFDGVLVPDVQKVTLQLGA